MTFNEFLDRIQDLRIDRSGPEPKPYKPVLLCSVVLLIHKGEIRTPEVFFDGGVKSVFYQLMDLLFGNRFASATIKMPFNHLRRDGFWVLNPKEGQEERLREVFGYGGDALQVMKHVRSATLDAEVFYALATSFENRFNAVKLLAATYNFPKEHLEELWKLFYRDTSDNTDTIRDSAPMLMTERGLEEFLEQNWRRTPFWTRGIELCSPEKHRIAGRQALTPVNAIDLLGYRSAEKEWWVFELKKGRTNDAVVGQVSRYMGWIKKHRATASENVCGAIIVGQADQKLISAVHPHPNISLWEYDTRLLARQIPTG
jgi:hypothetical protein